MFPNDNNLRRLKKRRKHFRNNSTSAEAELWGFLKSRQLDGRKFRRQFSVGEFILDFYCPQEMLCVELDGKDHFTDEGMKRDAVRDSILLKEGIRTLRFENICVWNNVEGVLEVIRKNFQTES